MGVYEVSLADVSLYRDYERFMEGVVSYRDLLALSRLSDDVARFRFENLNGMVPADREDVVGLLDRLEDFVEWFEGIDSGVVNLIEFEIVRDLYVVTYEEVSRVVYELKMSDRHLLTMYLNRF